MKHTILFTTVFVLLAALFLALFASTVSATLEITGEQLIIVGEDSSINDVLTGVTIVQFLKGAGYDAPTGSALLDKDSYEEFTSRMMVDYVFYVIDDKDISILLGEDVDSENEWIAEQAKDFLEGEGYTVNIITNPEREDLLVTYEPPVEEDDADEPVVCTMDVKECSDGSFVGRIAPDCEFEDCPEYVPELPEEQEVVCQGCIQDDECMTYGAIIAGQRYCADDGVVSAQKEAGMSCANNYECKNNNCIENECEVIKVKSKNIIVRFFSWLGGLFG